MKIDVNGEPKEFSANTCLQTVVDSVVSETNGTAVALNNTVVPKHKWPGTPVTESDKILIIKATQGG